MSRKKAAKKVSRKKTGKKTSKKAARKKPARKKPARKKPIKKVPPRARPARLPRVAPMAAAFARAAAPPPPPKIVVPGYGPQKLARVQRDLLKRTADLRDEIYMMVKLERRGKRQLYLEEARADLNLVKRLTAALPPHPLRDKLDKLTKRRLQRDDSRMAKSLARKFGFTLRQVYTLFFSP